MIYNSQLQVRRKIGGGIVSKKTLSSKEFEAFESRSNRAQKETLMEHTAVSLLENNRVTYDTDRLYYCVVDPINGHSIFKAGFHDYEYNAKLAHQKRVVDEAWELGMDAFKNQIRNPEDCKKMQLLLSSDTNWWPNHTEASARHLLLEKWSDGWLKEQHTQLPSQKDNNDISQPTG